MTILSDRQIRELCINQEKPMISPFVPNQVKEVDGKRILSYGLSSYGYDARVAPEFKIFTNINSTIVDPLEFDQRSYVDHEGEYCIIPPNSFVLTRTIEHFYIPEDVLVVVVTKSTMARCFTGDTKIMLADNTTPTFLEAMERVAKGERLWGYSVNDNLEIVMAELTLPRKIGTEKVIEVELDSGDIIKCTPDHKFITRSGLEIEAKDLKEGDSLFPFYRMLTPKGYYAVAQPNTWTYDFDHKLADDWSIRNGVYERDLEKTARHHIDHNKLNNVPTNILPMTPSDHTAYHNNFNAKNPEHLEKLSVGQKKSWEEKSKDPEWLNARLAQLKEMTNSFVNNDQARKRHVESLRRYWTTEEGLKQKEISRQLMRYRSNLAEHKQKASETLKNLWKDPEYRAMMSELLSEREKRKDITEETLVAALESEGTIRGAARKLNCDRSVFRRFVHIIADYKEKWEAAKITVDQFYKAICSYGSATKAAKMLGISRSYAKRHFKEAVSRFYGTPIGDNHKVVAIRETDSIEDVYCLTAEEFGNFALASGVFVNNCGVHTLATPLEPGWQGHVTLEFANTTNLPAKLYANQGGVQLLFLRGDDKCEVSYATRGGKYQGQTGITLPKG
ncbi:MAG: dCTP deaminase [Candidatus Dojkabacteria bacterium]